ncbi:MAG: 4-hydroxy-tetrahydrodipicolinate reductase, partial [Gemmatimonadetes bacterium]|nr:4-hydroxy-tetrahydrodipicolinate reductase [Gemmatimonadota bacterium]
IEFSTPTAAPGNLIRLAQVGIDVACGTTGWSDAASEVERAVGKAGTGLLAAPNFSLGVAAFTRLVRHAAQLAAGVPQYDVHLHEAHHRHKRDHPSGTARVLADAVVAALDRKAEWRLGPPEGTPDPAVLYVSVTRAGDIAGTHVVAFEGPHDRIELRHEARDRGAFASGAVEGARWIRGRAGVFGLDDWLRDRFT